MSLEALHRELEFETWKPQLQRITGVWDALLRLQRQASTSASARQKYRAYVERCIQKLQVEDLALPDAMVQDYVDRWQELQTTRNTALAERICSRRPLGVDAWCQKWLPRHYEDYEIALSAWVAHPCKRTGERLLDATRVMYDGFEKV